MRNVSIQLFVTASIIGLTAAAQAQDGSAVKVPEPLAGASELFKTAPTVADEATEKAEDMASDATEAAGDAAEKMGEAAEDAAADATEMATDAAENIKVPEPLSGSSDLFESAPEIAVDAPEMTEEKPVMAEEKADMAEEEPAEAMATMEHTIAAGDTLWDLAKSKLGDATKYPAIIEANPGINPHNLEIGAGLKLPAK